MELTTAEEVHVVCLFPALEHALDFDGYVLSLIHILFRMEGLPKRPLTAGKGGRGRGSPRWPSIEVTLKIARL